MYREGRDRWRLRDINFGGDRARLRGEALAELAEAGGRGYRAPAGEEATDDSATVRVAVDRSGRVADVHIRSDWRDRLGAGGLGPALLQARNNAAAAMARAAGLAALAERERMTAQGGEPDRGRRPVPYVEPMTIGQVWQQLSDNENRLYQRQKAARPGADSRTAGGALGLLSGRWEGRALVGITAEPMWVQGADTEQLRHAALELFRQSEARDSEQAR